MMMMMMRLWLLLQRPIDLEVRPVPEPAEGPPAPSGRGFMGPHWARYV